MLDSDIQHILAPLNRMWQASGGNTRVDALVNEVRDQLHLMCEGYTAQYYVRATYSENGRPKGFFVLSEEEDKCDIGFSGNPAWYNTEEEAAKRADIANAKPESRDSWEVHSRVRKATPPQLEEGTT